VPAVAKHGQEQEKKVFYERAIQNLEQQLQEFQRNLQEASAMEQGLDPISDRFDDDESIDLDENRDDQIVAEYVRRCKCVLVSYTHSRAEYPLWDDTRTLGRVRHFFTNI
jgi:hypothetical protein